MKSVKMVLALVVAALMFSAANAALAQGKSEGKGNSKKEEKKLDKEATKLAKSAEKTGKGLGRDAVFCVLAAHTTIDGFETAQDLKTKFESLTDFPFGQFVAAVLLVDRLDKEGFALNEVNLGVVVPSGFMRMAIAAVGVKNAREVILEGKTITPARALEMGLVDAVVKPEDVLERAISRARELAGKPPLAFGAVKQLFLEATGHSAAFTDRFTLSQFIEHWFSPEAMERKQALIQSMRRETHS